MLESACAEGLIRRPSGPRIEASPAVLGNTLVVGTDGTLRYSIQIKEFGSAGRLWATGRRASCSRT